jgi:metallo-beta-lactamase family protein
LVVVDASPAAQDVAGPAHEEVLPMSNSMPRLTFLGGAGTVTGSKTLLDTGNARILVDCGLFQGRKELRLANWAEFPVPPDSIDAVVLTHAHIDHCGYVPRLYTYGYRGPVFATPGTCDLAGIVLPDSGYLQEEEAAYANRKGFSKHHPAEPLYTADDARASLELFEPVSFEARRSVADGVDVTWRRAGHILGAASLRITVDDRTIVFSGDLGGPTHPLMRPPDPIGDADVVVVESTYGDEEHPDADAEEAIARVVNDAASCGGVVVVPAFAVDRTEVVLWHLDQLVKRGEVPDIPVVVPLGGAQPLPGAAAGALRARALLVAEHHRDPRHRGVEGVEPAAWALHHRVGLRHGDRWAGRPPPGPTDR